MFPAPGDEGRLRSAVAGESPAGLPAIFITEQRPGPAVAVLGRPAGGHDRPQPRRVHLRLPRRGDVPPRCPLARGPRGAVRAPAGRGYGQRPSGRGGAAPPPRGGGVVGRGAGARRGGGQGARTPILTDRRDSRWRPSTPRRPASSPDALSRWPPWRASWTPGGSSTAGSRLPSLIPSCSIRSWRSSAVKWPGLELHPPAMPWISNLTGTWITPEQAVDAGYWVRHLREAVRFSDGVQELLKTPPGLPRGRPGRPSARW